VVVVVNIIRATYARYVASPNINLHYPTARKLLGGGDSQDKDASGRLLGE